MPNALSMHDLDTFWLRHCFKLASAAVDAGDHPFAAVFVVDGAAVMEGLNTVCSDWDPTAHGEMKILRAAAAQLSQEQLSTGTLYSSMEPCAMCAGAMHWLGIRRVVYGCSANRLAEFTKNRLRMTCREVFATSDSSIEVVGPLLEDEAFELHRAYWQLPRKKAPGIYGV